MSLESTPKAKSNFLFKTIGCILIALAIIFILLFFGRVWKQNRLDNSKDGLLTNAAKPGNYELSIQSAGLNRTYQLYIPSSYDGSQAVPLVLSLHGAGGSAENAKNLSQFDSKAEKEGFIVAYPEGMTIGKWLTRLRVWNAGNCEATDNNADDVTFISDLIDELKSNLNIDSARVYASGMSNGGMMTYRLACELADKIAAVAVVAGSMSLDYEKCQVARPIPLLHIHGWRDDVVRVVGGSGVNVTISGCVKTSTLETMRQWKGYNGCPGEAEKTYDQGRAVCHSYLNCQGGAEVTLCMLKEVGHTWPMLPEFNSTDYIWDFFSKYSL